MEKDADGKDDPVATLSAVVSGGRIKCKWQVKYTADEDDADSQQELAEKGYTLPEYAFVVECGGERRRVSEIERERGQVQLMKLEPMAFSDEPASGEFQYKELSKQENPIVGEEVAVYEEEAELEKRDAIGQSRLLHKCFDTSEHGVTYL